MSVPLVPAPVHMAVGSGSFELIPGGVAAPPQFAGVAQLFADEVARESGISLTVASSDSASPVITVELSSEGLDAVARASGNRADGNAEADERYGLAITTEGVRVWAATPEGVFRGLASLRQLIAAGASDGVATLPVIEVVDGPRYAWRGISFDVVRTFHGPETVRRVIDMLAVHKLNVLHLHLTDDQGWRIEVPSRPALTEVGSTGAIGDRPGGFYTVAEMAELVKYAADRFITIVPEIDMPGHTGAIFRSYPELAPTKGFSGDIAPGLAVGTLDPGRPETWEFVGDVLDDIIPQFPNTAYIHIGGDEAFGMPVEEHAAFMERATRMVRDRGRFAVVWQEAARGNLSSQDVVQYWMDARDTGAMLANEALTAMVPEEMLGVLKETLSHVAQDVPRALEMGTKLIVSPTSRLYFDRPQGDASLPIDTQYEEVGFGFNKSVLTGLLCD
ncbi:family 20 glycosylhydrolase [Schaalia sp. JY-X169]|uniref:family 20 glycosylhydrolase n=1 Tax=Schaalia sp. JY-X169 TaxID=2758572 RepID=UPI001C716B20|nr:family 20 glycosylhydrolase [Schaalia sp. JY-X169]